MFNAECYGVLAPTLIMATSTFANGDIKTKGISGAALSGRSGYPRQLTRNRGFSYYLCVCVCVDHHVTAPKTTVLGGPDRVPASGIQLHEPEEHRV